MDSRVSQERGLVPAGFLLSGFRRSAGFARPGSSSSGGTHSSRRPGSEVPRWGGGGPGGLPRRWGPLLALLDREYVSSIDVHPPRARKHTNPRTRLPRLDGTAARNSGNARIYLAIHSSAIHATACAFSPAGLRTIYPVRHMSQKKRWGVRKSSPESGNRWHWRSRPAAWIVASLAGAAVPIVLYFVYARFPGARPWIALGNDGPFQPAIDEKGSVVVPIWGFPAQGAYLALFLSAVVAYWGVGSLLSIWKTASTEEEENVMPPVLIPAISVLLFTLPMISAG